MSDSAEIAGWDTRVPPSAGSWRRCSFARMCSHLLGRSELVLAKNAQPSKVLVRRGLAEDTDSQVQSKRCECPKLLSGTMQTWHWSPVPQAARLKRCEADPLPCYSSLSVHSLTKRHDTGTPATVGQRSSPPARAVKGEEVLRNHPTVQRFAVLAEQVRPKTEALRLNGLPSAPEELFARGRE